MNPIISTCRREDFTPDAYYLALDVLRQHDVNRLADLGKTLAGFPHGVDDLIGRAWITNAIDVGSHTAIRWLLNQQVNLDFRDEEGYTPTTVRLKNFFGAKDTVFTAI